jgi:hypothetical protein
MRIPTLLQNRRLGNSYLDHPDILDGSCELPVAGFERAGSFLWVGYWLRL